MKRPELRPCGQPARYALRLAYGADAVYVSAAPQSARVRNNEFSDYEVLFKPRLPRRMRRASAFT